MYGICLTRFRFCVAAPFLPAMNYEYVFTPVLTATSGTSYICTLHLLGRILYSFWLKIKWYSDYFFVKLKRNGDYKGRTLVLFNLLPEKILVGQVLLYNLQWGEYKIVSHMRRVPSVIIIREMKNYSELKYT